jgi:NADH-quinone oxidoreductase subunit H
MAQFLTSVALGLFVLLGVILPACAYLIFLERKVASWVQDRIGPNRTNFSFGLIPFPERWHMLGLGQALADGLKLLIKEDYTPPRVDKVLFWLAPILVVVPAMIGGAVIPWGGYFQLWQGGPILQATIAPVHIGVVYILAVGSLAVYGVVLGAYASNNKYSFLGGLRATAQMLSYEIPMGLCVLIMILTYAATSATHMAEMQSGSGFFGIGGGDGVQAVVGTWGLFLHPMLAIIFFTCVLAETNRAPFDLAEAEQELVGGYHTEYSSMSWALFFLGEYMHMITGCAFFCVLFLGGGDLIPFVRELPAIAAGPWWWALILVFLKMNLFFFKIALLLFLMMWIRWTLPRFRFDQLMQLAWRGLIPITLAILLITGLLVFFHAPIWCHLIADLGVMFAAVIVGPLVPRAAPINRRIPLAGSRFSPA